MESQVKTLSILDIFYLFTLNQNMPLCLYNCFTIIQLYSVCQEHFNYMHILMDEKENWKMVDTFMY